MGNIDKDITALILMASYNGEKYIATQIESIVNQTFQNWHLIIRDDGSVDGTLDIIKHYCEVDSRITLIQNDTSRHGAYLNFFTLINYSQGLEAYDYYFFSDQDDIWLEHKIEKMIAFAETNNVFGKPMLVYSDMQVIDEQGKMIYPSINQIMGSGKISGLSLCFIHSYLWGCDIMLNRNLFISTPCFPLKSDIINIMSHDNYFGIFALIVGEILYLPQPLIQYRRHGGNKTSAFNFRINLIKGIKRLVLEWKDLVKTHTNVYNQTLQTINIMQKAGIMDARLDDIQDAIIHGGFRAIKVLRKYDFTRKQRYRLISTYLILLLKRHQKYLLIPNAED